jgi:two-component system, NtrC family, response regulator
MGQVLIIDDDPDYAEMMSRYVAGLGHNPLTAGLLRAGRQAAVEHSPDVVLLDVNLPDGNGLHAIRDLLNTPGKPEVIVITGEGSEDGAELAITSGAWDFWQKGRSIKDLAAPLFHAIEYRNERLSRPRARTLNLGGIIGESPVMRSCYDVMAEAAASEAPVLVRGETGTGKELAARAIHDNSARAQAPFVVVDCAALPETLVESLLFGHDKGAYTGASNERVGLVRQAHRGTLFLDEIGELPLSVQKAFLRVLQEKRFRPVGSDREISSDFRLIAATNRDLARMVREGKFREDLYFRLRSLDILLPPLREREGDVALIINALVRNLCERAGVPPKALTESFTEMLAQYPWPGNVRELTNVIERAVAAGMDRQVLQPVHLPAQVRVLVARAAVRQDLNLQRPQAPYASYPTLASARDSAIAAYLTKLLDDTKGNVEAACRLADLSRSRLYELLKLHGIQRSPIR